jgi:hypothetical protein
LGALGIPLLSLYTGRELREAATGTSAA